MPEEAPVMRTDGSLDMLKLIGDYMMIIIIAANMMTIM
jgi:hypothetical protein